jgi:hypothetical protein
MKDSHCLLCNFRRPISSHFYPQSTPYNFVSDSFFKQLFRRSFIAKSKTNPSGTISCAHSEFFFQNFLLLLYFTIKDLLYEFSETLLKYEIAFNRNIKLKRLQKLSEQPVY